LKRRIKGICFGAPVEIPNPFKTVSQCHPEAKPKDLAFVSDLKYEMLRCASMTSRRLFALLFLRRDIQLGCLDIFRELPREHGYTF
jgi:hypothetical protein